MKSLLPALLAVISAIIAVFSFLQYQKTAGTMWIVLTLIFLVAALGLGAMFLSGRVNKTEDIHITE
jgi:ABC-type lipoprotein release transport system permease subunit